MNNNPIDYNRYYIWGWHDDSKYQFSIDRILKDSPNKIVIFAPEESEHDRQLVDVTYSKLDGDITVDQLSQIFMLNLYLKTLLCVTGQPIGSMRHIINTEINHHW